MTTMRRRDLDIVIWGATGFVGRQVARHMASRVGRDGLRWALGGRSRARLEKIRADLGPVAAGVPVLVGNSHDAGFLDTMAARAKVICSTVGPFARYGTELIAASVRNGTHYCDVSGEVHWMRKMIDAHQILAERTGARIVPACGFDSIPSDIGVFFLQKEARRRQGRPCSHIKMSVEAWKAGLSGGTVASVFNAMEESRKDPSAELIMSAPYSLNPEGQREGPDVPDEMMPVKVTYDEDLGAWTTPFFMGPINAKIVRRSNALLGYPYGKEFRYQEAVLAGKGLAGWVRAAMGVAGAGGAMLAIALSPTRWLLRRFVLPGPGQGPDQERRESGFFDLLLVGKMDDGSVMRARIRGLGDPAVESTSRMLVESALCLHQDADRITVGGGFWTPASAMGDLLLKRLPSHAGLSFLSI